MSAPTTSSLIEDHIKGITIGGWLVTEPYITPSLYNNATSMNRGNISIVDEYTLCFALGYNKSLSILSEHFETWITEDDFQEISESGFNLVRLPIGYWAWKVDHASGLYVENITYSDPYVSEGLQLGYLKKAIGWAEKYGLKVWIDLHGLPGSQNGFDNSGERILRSNLGWLNEAHTKKLTLAIWSKMFKEFIGYSDSIVGMEIVNEPLSTKIGIDDITEAYYEAFDLFKFRQRKSNDSVVADNMTFVIHDAFEPIGYWNLQFNPQYVNVSSQYYNLTNITYNSQDISVDHHHYEVFTESQLQESQYQRLINIINYGDSIYGSELSSHGAVVGEWSGALTDCATWVNGIGIGSRYDGTYYDNMTMYSSNDDSVIGACTSQDDISSWSQEYKEHVRQFIEAQLATYSSRTSGWIFWNWKTESAGEWDFLKLRDAGLFPTPFDNYTYFGSDGSMNSQVSQSLSLLAYPTSSGVSSGDDNPKTKNVGVRRSTPVFAMGNKKSDVSISRTLSHGMLIFLGTLLALCIFI